MTGWEMVRDKVLARIRARDWPPGSTLPPEPALAASLGVSRGTVNRALTALAADGLLERRRKGGTRVAVTPVRRATFAIPVMRQEIEARGQVYRHRLLVQRRSILPEALADRAGLPHGTRLWYLETLHLADGRPAAFETRWLNPATVPDLPDLAAISANEWLVRNVMPTAGEIVFSAAPANAAEARWLDVDPGAALFVTERTTWAGAQVITLVRQVHPPGHRVVTAI